MGDRCYLEMTLRREDLPRFAEHVDASPNEKWWDAEDDLEDHPNLITVRIYEANYAWYDERRKAAEAGIPFFGTHGEGGEYGSFAFAAIDGELEEAPLSHDGDLIISVDENLQPLWGVEELRAYMVRLQAVKKLFGIEEIRREDPARASLVSLANTDPESSTEILDELVGDLYSGIAADINNGGFERQIAELLNSGMMEETLRLTLEEAA